VKITKKHIRKNIDLNHTRGHDLGTQILLIMIRMDTHYLPNLRS
jgi:hypothetical protein